MENQTPKISIIPDAILPHVEMDRHLGLLAEKANQHLQFLKSVEYDHEIPVPSSIYQPIEAIIGRDLELDPVDKDIAITVQKAIIAGIVQARIAIQTEALKIAPGFEAAFAADPNQVAGILGPVTHIDGGSVELAGNAEVLRKRLEAEGLLRRSERLLRDE